MKVSDSLVEAISLLLIFAGLLVCLFFVLDNNPSDAFFLLGDDQNAFLSGRIISSHFSNKSGYTRFSIYSCRSFESFYKGFSEVEGEVVFYGEYFDGVFSIKRIERANSS